MKIHHFISINVTATFDTASLKRSISSLFPDNEIELIKLKYIEEGIHVKNVFKGEIISIEDVTYRIPCSIDCFLFPSGIYICKITFECENLIDELKSSLFLEKKNKLISVNEERNDPITVIIQLFIFKIFNLSVFIEQISSVSILDQNAQIKMNETIKNISKMDTCFVGNEIYFDLRLKIEDSVIIDNDKEKINYFNDWESISSQPDQIFMKDNIYYCLTNSESFLEDYLIYIYRKKIFTLYTNILMKWIITIKKEAKAVKGNLKEANRIYWEKLKSKLEIWDLNFLDLYTSIVHSLNDIERLIFSSINDNFNNKIKNEFKDTKQILIGNMNDVKYSLANLNTPCHFHDEIILQKETEKGNERILLLSFLAVSIPLLGAIYAPGILINYKIISALIIISLPFAYMNIRKFHIKRDEKLNNKKYLQNIKASYQQDIDSVEKTITEIEDDMNLSKETKNEIISMVLKNMEITKTQIVQIDEELKKH